MSISSELHNRALIRELEREFNTDVILFGFDGFTYFGNLQGIDDCRIAILTPAINASSTNVEVLTPGGEVVEVEFARVDLCQIVAKGTGIVSDPLLSTATIATLNAEATRDEKAAEEADRQGSHHLIRMLRQMIGCGVTITTLGGFLFEGVLGSVENELAILSVDDIFVPGTSSPISDTRVRSVVVNLAALTAVLGPNSNNCC